MRENQNKSVASIQSVCHLKKKSEKIRRIRPIRVPLRSILKNSIRTFYRHPFASLSIFNVTDDLGGNIERFSDV